MSDTDGAVHSPVVRRLAAQLLPRAHELAGVLVESIVRRAETYAGTSGSGVGVEDLWESCETNIERMCQDLADAVPSGADPLDAPRRTGERRAEQRVPLEAVLASYRQCGRVVWQGLVEELQTASAGQEQDFLLAAGEVWSVIDVYSHAVSEGYRAREAELQHRDRGLRDALMLAVLEGHHDGPLVRAAEALDLPTDTPLVCVVVDLPGSGRDPLPGVHGQLLGRGVPSSWVRRANAVVGLVAMATAAHKRVIDEVLQRVGVGTAGVSAPFAGLPQAAEGYRMAQLALRTAPGGDARVVWLEDRLPAAFVVQNPDLAELALQRVLGPLEGAAPAERAALLETLRALLTNEGSATAAARQLYCHRNTVLKRLQRIEALTGGSLRDPEHVALCFLALAWCDLSRSRPGHSSNAGP